MARPVAAGPEPEPVLGSPSWVEDIGLDTVGALSRAYRLGGELVAIPKGDDRTYLAFHPAHVKSVLIDPETFNVIGAPGPRRSAQRRFSLGLLGLNGPQHLRHRRLLMPALGKPAVAGHVDGIARVVDRHLANWREGQTLDLAREMRLLALSLAGKLLLGLDEFPGAAEIAGAFQRWVQAYVGISFATVLPVEPSPGAYQQLLDSAEELDSYFRALVDYRRKTLRDDQQDMFAILLRAHGQGALSEDELLGELHTLVNASYQTTASALMWTLLLLALHPYPARDLASELHEHDGLPAGTDSALEHVIKESMRILPPVAYTVKQAFKPSRLGTLPVPMGTVVILSFYVTHHLPAFYPEPERFLPERWRGFSPSPWAYFPYSSGPRMCLGAGFAHQVLRAGVGSVWRRFRLSVASHTVIDRASSITLGSRQAVPVTLHAQDGRGSTTPVLGDIHEMVQLPAAEAERRAA